MSARAIFKTNNNQIPCEGPRAIRLEFDFQMGGEMEVDFAPDVQRGVISEIQSAYVDNLDGSEVTIVCNMTRQRVTVPAGYQGYVQLLLGTDAKFLVQMPNPGRFIMHAMNMPVVHSLVASNASASPPINPGSAGTPGQYAYDANFFYWCFAPNAWARAPRDNWS